MEIPGINASDAIFGSTQAEGAEGLEGPLGKQSFMELLVAQLKSQDPLNPTQNEEMVAQLATFSSLEQLQNLNENIVGLAVLQQNNALLSQLVGGSELIGKSVRFTDPQSGETATGTVLSVKLQEGLATLNIDGRDIPLVNVNEVTPGE